MLTRNQLLLILGLAVVVVVVILYFYVFAPPPPPVGEIPKVPVPSNETVSQLTEVANKTEKKELKIVLTSVESMFPGMETVLFDGERITEINLAAFSKDDISRIDFCKYSYEIYLNGKTRVDYQSCTTKKINENTALITLKTNIRASKSSYLSIYPKGEPPVLGIDELRIG